MTFPIPPVDADPTVQFALDLLARQLPLGTQQIQNGAVTAPKLATGIVLQLASTGTARKVAFGTGNLAFTASTASNTGTVTHGLGGTPVIYAGFAINSASGQPIVVTAFNATSTSIDFTARTNAAITFTQPFGWLAIG